ncbi:MAG: hypothetical protein LBC74_08325 [Planctomycetaceae bacterium]|jgi:lipopolysaccharide export LptBFGC system permease protein LptF|nr:hypothetical protein [Planctomycetaceae bacterium]
MNTIISTLSTAPFDVLFGGAFTGLGAIVVFIIYIVYNIAVSISEARQTAINKAKSNAEKQNQNQNYSTNQDQVAEQEIIYTSKPSEQKKKRNFRKAQPQIPDEIIDNTTKEPKNTRKVLVRELPQQGQGSRFEVAPGTLKSIQLTPIVEATVNTELDSLTGIYEQHTQNTEEDKQTQNIINLNDILTTHEGIRNSVILSEILNRPHF